jgi:hypothetical protein
VAHGAAEYGATAYGTAAYGTAEYGTAEYGTVEYGAAEYGEAAHGNKECGTAANAWKKTAITSINKKNVDTPGPFVVQNIYTKRRGHAYRRICQDDQRR